jgi:hypothetical protein
MSGWGVLGFGGDVAKLPSNATNVVPVHPGVGVYGGAGYGEGLNPSSGVVGDADSDNLGLSPFNIFTNCGVAGCGPTGVYGFSALGYGVLGASLERGMAGVLGVGPKGGRGVTGHVTASKTADDAHTYAIHGLVTPYSPHPQGGPYAGWFDGPVMVNGDFTIAGGGKSVAVPFTDGSHRRLYCMESPECWFEDFGEGRLKSGRAVVKINADFAKVIKPGDHHIFFTPKGDCRGLYVHRQGGASFEVRELQGGKSNVAFSYRIVGRRKDFKAERFAKVAIPKAPKPPKLPAAPKVKERSPTKPSVGRPPSGALSAD